MKLIFLCDEQIFFDGEVTEITIKTQNGPMEILPGHAPYLAKISENVSYKDIEGNETLKDITEGFVYTNGEECFIVIDDIRQG